MPYIECHIATGLTKARKTQLIRDIVQVTHESIGSDPKIINVLLFEHPADNMSISGRIHGEEAPKQVVGEGAEPERGQCVGAQHGPGGRSAIRLRMESSCRAPSQCERHRSICVTTSAHRTGFLKSVERSR